MSQKDPIEEIVSIIGATARRCLEENDEVWFPPVGGPYVEKSFAFEEGGKHEFHVRKTLYTLSIFYRSPHGEIDACEVGGITKASQLLSFVKYYYLLAKHVDVLAELASEIAKEREKEEAVLAKLVKFAELAGLAPAGEGGGGGSAESPTAESPTKPFFQSFMKLWEEGRKYDAVEEKIEELFEREIALPFRVEVKRTVEERFVVDAELPEIVSRAAVMRKMSEVYTLVSEFFNNVVIRVRSEGGVRVEEFTVGRMKVRELIMFLYLYSLRDGRGILDVLEKAGVEERELRGLKEAVQRMLAAARQAQLF
ncbi:MAG: hypothetical protein QXT28_10125 [Thermofilaceae archaeon]